MKYFDLLKIALSLPENLSIIVVLFMSLPSLESNKYII